MKYIIKLIFTFFVFLIVIFPNCNTEKVLIGKYGGYTVDSSTDLVITDCMINYGSTIKYTDTNGYFEFEEEYTSIPNGANTIRSIVVEASKTGYITDSLTLFKDALDTKYKLTPE